MREGAFPSGAAGARKSPRFFYVQNAGIPYAEFHAYSPLEKTRKIRYSILVIIANNI